MLGHVMILFLTFLGTAKRFFQSGCTTVHLFEGSSISAFSPIYAIFHHFDYVCHSVKRYIIVVPICISLIINDIEYLFMCLLVIYISSLKKYVTLLKLDHL
jgi:hypothetical protein